MDFLRYVVEAKDQYGWFDYAFLTTLEEATKLAKDLKEGFGDNIRVIDRLNMIEYDQLTEATRDPDFN